MTIAVPQPVTTPKKLPAPPAPSRIPGDIRGRLDFQTDMAYTADTGLGLTRATVEEISRLKDEPEWMLAFRLRAYEHFLSRPMPEWGGDLSHIDLSKLTFFRRPGDKESKNWEDVPESVKLTFEKLGVPEAERKYLSGVVNQIESESIYHSVKDELAKLGVIFMGTDQALKEYPELFRKYFGTVVPPEDNKFAALNSACWSGGAFLFVPKGVDVPLPLQAYFRINAEATAQFERTLIIIEEGAKASYLESCSAPIYTTASLHAAVVEVVALPGAKVRYTTMQTWPNDVYNLVTKRAHAYENAIVEWIDYNGGCIAEGSLISSERGEVPIESLEVGERVATYDKTIQAFCLRPITAKRFSGFQPVRELSASGRRLRATDNHPFLSYHYDPKRASKLGRYRIGYLRADQVAEAFVPSDCLENGQDYPLWIPAREIVTSFTGGNQYQSAFYSRRARQSTVNPPEITDPELMWLFGLFLGDGDIAKKMAANGGVRWGKVGFSVPANDRARSKLMALMSKYSARPPTERKDGIHLDWNSVELVEFFERNGFNSGAHTKSLPAWVMTTPPEQRRALLAGYLDSDGHVLVNGRYVAIKSVNKALLRQVGRLVISLGLNMRINTEFDEAQRRMVVGREATVRGAHLLVFPADDRILAHCSDDFRRAHLKRLVPKANTRQHIGRSTLGVPKGLQLVSVKSAKASSDLVPTWDIEVDGTGNFVVEGFVVHNSRLTMKYPSIYLRGRGASADIISVAVAGPGQHQDTGAKAIHLAPDTRSRIVSKSISYGGGRATYRGSLKVAPGATGVVASVRCDALMLDSESRSDTYPYIDINEDDTTMTHEATVGKISAEQIFYLMTRGLTEDEAQNLIIQGFLEVFTKELPMEYAVEFNRLIRLEMTGSLG